MNSQSQKSLKNGLHSLNEWINSYGDWKPDETLQVPEEKAAAVFDQLTQRLKGNYPFEHPVYAGQMLKPPHPLAWAAYAMAMSINPNNHALDGGPPSSEMEKEAIAELAEFFGYGDTYLGHLTASGTIANLEALWIARESNPDKKIAFSDQAHYTHSRMCSVLRVEGIKIPVTEKGVFDLDAMDPNQIGTIVVTLGTTGLGDVESLDQILPWAQEHGIRIHVDAAYGGFFRVLMNSDLIDSSSWKLMQEADSIVVDPHKHGLQPYGCGCVLFKDPKVGKFYKHNSPYTYFTSNDLHLGEISLECSRAGAAAVALWTTLQLFPLKENEGFGPILSKCRKAALKMYDLTNSSSILRPYKQPELDILGYFPVTVKSTSEISSLSKQIFDKGMNNRSYYLSLYRIPTNVFTQFHPEFKADSEDITILRSVFMKPEHEGFVSELFKSIEHSL